MTHTPLSNADKQDLRTVLESPLFRKVMQEALTATYREKAGAASLEQAAMAYNYTEGARGVLNRLLGMAEIKEELAASTNGRRFRPTND